ncbi:hypothetical protein PIB30_009455 [Stylosanthes scabra]|uniref:Uncharacterized protein n=1 Tax=Stylosanthes scabra TaxID=79078 RepID=A0ABU6X346_9FABA|nr:hypothetical protein [Stylosanthes scabra]
MSRSWSVYFEGKAPRLGILDVGTIISEQPQTLSKNFQVSSDVQGTTMECKCCIRMRKIRLRSGKEVIVQDRNMAEERASNSSTSTDDSTATDKTYPSPSRAKTTPLNASASGWIPTQTGANWGP